MRTIFASTSRSLCASCNAQPRACPRLASASAAARTYSAARPAPRVPLKPQTRQHRQQQQQQQRRWLSSQSQPEAAEDAQRQRQDRSRPANNESGHTKPPLPYYDLFPETLPQGPPPDGPFDIDLRALRREFLRLQAASHPDYFHSASTSSNPSSSPSDPEDTSAARRHRQAEAASSHINAAYKTLSHPLLRAQYILAERYGVDLAGDEAGSHAGGAAGVGAGADPGLLVEVLEAREAIEEAESEDDLEGPMAENEGRIARCVEGLRQAFAEGDVEAAVGEAVRLRYWESIKEGIRGWEKGVGGGLLHH
ncbi:DnaJ domain-containing protein [Diaporthe helianthi]|uniref:DnaJ domain-containing protein n=1 Tax=Diaporthe helianthi TaxID=158607 RepID=A0A2P5HZ58_DIAHE|nr:DnaJ domain-containing protein [Diaporthe helianthi]